MALCDVCFASECGRRRDIEFAIRTTDGRRRAITVHYSSCSFHCVFLPVMAAEIHALFLAFNRRYVIWEELKDMLGCLIAIKAYGNSLIPSNIIAKGGRATERKLHLDSMELKKSPIHGEMGNLRCISRREKAAAVLNKKKHLKNHRCGSCWRATWLIRNQSGGRRVKFRQSMYARKCLRPEQRCLQNISVTKT